jgi:hypothetical protein
LLEAGDEAFAGVEQAFEGDGAGGWAVVEEDGERRSAVGEAEQIG